MKKSRKLKKPVSKNVLYLISAGIVLTIIVAGIQEPQNVRLQAQTASQSAGISPALSPEVSPAFGCLGNCPFVITPAVSPVTISPGAGAVIPVVSGGVSPAVSGNPQNPAGVPPGAQIDPLEGLENPNGKIPPGRLKHFINNIVTFFLALFGLGGNPAGNPNVPGGAQINPAGGAQQQLPDGQQADPNQQGDIQGGNQQGNKPGYGNNPGSENPGGNIVQPQSQKKIELQQQQEQQQQAQQGATVPGALNQPGATNGGAVNPQTTQQSPFTVLVNFLTQLFGGQPATK